MKDHKNIFAYLFYADLPLLAMGGFAVGALIVGFFQITFGASTFFEPQKCDWGEFLKGAACLGVSLFTIGFMALYWRFILRKQGAVYPEVNWVGLIVALLALFSGVSSCILLMYRVL